MHIDLWIHDLPARLELAAEVLDDLANGDWVTSDEDRDRLFAIEAQLWRIAQTVRKGSEQTAELLPFLDRSLQAVRSNVRLCLRIPVCEEDDGVVLLDSVAVDLFEIHRQLEALTDAAAVCLAAGGRS
jgi:hypothetical protein